MSFEKREIGKRGEAFVTEWLKKKGFTILGRNITNRIGELDIVALHPDGNTVSFVEVRTRNQVSLGHPLETIGSTKQSHIRRAAQLFLIKNKLLNNAVQFDVASIVWSTNEFTYLENVF